MENPIVWFLDKGHWLIIVGIILAVLGAFYNAYGLDQDHKFFGGLTQGLLFGLVGGGIVGLGLGLISVLLSVVASFLPGEELSVISAINVIIAFILIGFILGIIFGFLVGFRLNTLQQKTAFQKKASPVIYVASLLIFTLTITMQFILNAFENYFHQATFTNFLNIPLFGGFLFGLMFPNINTSYKLLFKKFGKELTLSFSLIVICLLSLFLVFAVLINDGSLFFWLTIAVDFLAGLLVSIELNQRQHSLVSLSKPSWRTFFLWIFIVAFFGAVLFIFGIFIFHSILIFLAQEIIIVVGIVIGLRRGNIGSFLTKPEPIYKVVCERDEKGVSYFKIRSPIDWSKFFRGFVIGLTIYGLYTFAGPLPTSFDAIYYTFASGLVASIPIGFMLGSIYGIGPAIYAWVKSLPDYRLGQIGVFLTVLGIFLLALPTLIV